MVIATVVSSILGEKKIREPFGEARIRDYNVAIKEDTQPPPKEIRLFDPLTQLELSN